MSSLDDGDDKPDRSLLELVILAESRGYKQAEQVGVPEDTAYSTLE